MSRETTNPGPDAWMAVDAYLEGLFTDRDRSAAAVLRAQHDAGLPDISVSPLQGKLLAVLAHSIGAVRALEFGTLGGYSTLWLARALPAHGHVVSFERDPHHAATARANLEAAGVGHKVTIRVGEAISHIETLADEDPFDIVFIDADKPNNVHYYEAALTRTRRGSLIIVDNVVRDGAIAEPRPDNPGVTGARAVMERAAHDQRVDATVVQTVGRKFYDGMLIATVL
jgi:predicted O-methyltransferase YrrM